MIKSLFVIQSGAFDMFLLMNSRSAGIIIIKNKS
jgi:hypothetical protein